MLNFRDIISVFLVMFAVIDILGSIPIILTIKNKGGHIKAGQATLVALAIFIAFHFLGVRILNLFHMHCLHLLPQYVIRGIVCI